MNRPDAPASVPATSLSRRCFHDPSAAPEALAQERSLLRLLLAQDGSTTRICEAISGGPLALQVIGQSVTSAVPGIVRQLLPGERFIERYSSLGARGQIMMDNLSYIALDRLTPELRRSLESGSIPIGHLLETLWVRRRLLSAEGATDLRERLWRMVGLPDASATRDYTITTSDGPLFLITETYRRGMRMEPGPADAKCAATGP